MELERQIHIQNTPNREEQYAESRGIERQRQQTPISTENETERMIKGKKRQDTKNRLTQNTIKQKSVVDKITVSNLLFQMKTAEHAIIKLLEEIDNGNLHPRTFEVLILNVLAFNDL